MGCGNSKKPANDPSGAIPVSANLVKPTFTLDDRVKCKGDGKEGRIVSVKDGGDPSVLFDGEEQAREIASTSIETLAPAAKQAAEEKQPQQQQLQQQPEQHPLEPEGQPQELDQQSKFVVGDRVKCKEDGKRGTVLFVYDDGDPSVKIDGDDEARPRVAAWFDVVGAEPEEVEANAPPLQDDQVEYVSKAEDVEGVEATDDQVRTEQCSLFKWW